MKISVCDKCLSEGRINASIWRVRDRHTNITLHFCTEHKHTMRNGGDTIALLTGATRTMDNYIKIEMDKNERNQ